MFDTSIIEVTLGMVFIFSLISILVTQINSFISNALRLRAKHLREGLSHIIKDDKLQAKLLAHPLINLVTPSLSPSAPVSMQTAEAVSHAQPESAGYQLTDVTYVAPETFVEAFVGTLLAQADEALYIPLKTAVESLPTGDYKTKLRAMVLDLELKFSHQKLDTIRHEINNAPDDIKPIMTAALAQTDEAYNHICYEVEDLVPLLAGIRQINNEAFKQAVEAILITADTLDDARKKLEAWFDGGMKRASDNFKNNMAWISFGVAFLVALILNIDTFHIARVLWTDPELSAQVAAIATAYQPPADVIIVQPTEPEPGATPDPAAEATTQEIIQEAADDAAEIAGTLDALMTLNLPIGWELTAITPEQATTLQAGQIDPYDNPRNLWLMLPGNSPNWFLNLLIKLLGLLTTALAGAQGAPFWFDLLKKITAR